VPGVSQAGFKSGDAMTVAVQMPGGRIVRGQTTVVGHRGYTIISDIDDTVKDTRVLQKTIALKRTFCQDFTPIPGMPEFYQTLYQKLRIPGKIDTAPHPPVFHFLSASPYELYPALIKFLHTFKFPPATIIPAYYRVVSVIKSLTTDLKKYKYDGTRSIMQQFPERKYILIGDSGQLDPEAYGAAFRTEQPGAVQCILIRLVVGQNQDVETKKNSPMRFRAAFFNVPSQNWRVFNDPKQLQAVPFEQGLCYGPGEQNEMARAIDALPPLVGAGSGGDQAAMAYEPIPMVQLDSSGSNQVLSFR